MLIWMIISYFLYQVPIKNKLIFFIVKIDVIKCDWLIFLVSMSYFFSYIWDQYNGNLDFYSYGNLDFHLLQNKK